ncbi:MAG: hypothetical protein EOP10_32260, partial [Proteobacteria bacterium]
MRRKSNGWPQLWPLVFSRLLKVKNMTLVFVDSVFEKHRTGYHHPETSERVARSLHYLERRPWFQDLKRGRFAEISDERLFRTHDASVLETLKAAAEDGGGHLDADTYVSRESLEVSRLAAGASLAACEAVLSSSAANAFC